MTYFIHVAGGNGLNSLASNPCTLLDFQRLMLQDGEVFEGSTAGREVLAVIFGGRGNFRVNGQDLGRVGGRPNVFAGKPHSVYIPCQSTYSVTASGSLEIGLCSAPSDLAVEPYVIGPDVVTSGVWGAANFTRSFHQILTEAGQPDLPAARLIVGET
ncbi:MAG: 5-deoxy-glucuronate isomerase, partial [Anaerolineae bacterium]|nr:5-deoxy-glucuronate isomerase [Anaerolineae bacterium]